MTRSLLHRTRATPRVTIRRDRLFWEPSRVLRRRGWSGRALGPVSAEALNAADELNAAADAALGDPDAPAPGRTTIAEIAAAYRADPAFLERRDTTRRHYARHLRRIVADHGAKRPDQLTPAEVRSWHKRFAIASPTDAYHHHASLRMLLDWHGGPNPARGLRLGAPTRRNRVGTRAELWAMVAAARELDRPSIAVAALLAPATMQRIGDVLSWDAAQISAGRVFFTQSKTGIALSPPIHPTALELVGDAGPLVRSETSGAAYTERAFQRAWAAVRARAARACPSLLGADDLVREPTLQGELRASDLRRTGMVWAAEGGAQVPAICSVSGHSIENGTAILETYLPRSRLLAAQAIARLDMENRHDGPELVAI